METSNLNLFELQVDHQGNAFLKEAAKWARFLGIVGFIGCGFGVLFALFAGSYMTRYLEQAGGAAVSAGTGVFFTVFYLLFSALYFFPCLYLFNFGTKMKLALARNDMETLNLSFRNLKACFRFVGILTIVVIALTIIPFLFALPALFMM
jgi:hypothetical protein